MAIERCAACDGRVRSAVRHSVKRCEQVKARNYRRERREEYFSYWAEMERRGYCRVTAYGAGLLGLVGVPTMSFYSSTWAAPREMVSVLRLIRSRIRSRKKRLEYLQKAVNDPNFAESLSTELSIIPKKTVYERA